MPRLFSQVSKEPFAITKAEPVVKSWGLTHIAQPPRHMIPAWAYPTWWHQQVSATPSQECPRCGNTAYPTYATQATGRSLVLACVICGWERALLVQDGWDQEPEAPSTILTKPAHHHVRPAGVAQGTEHRGGWRGKKGEGGHPWRRTVKKMGVGR